MCIFVFLKQYAYVQLTRPISACSDIFPAAEYAVLILSMSQGFYIHTGVCNFDFSAFSFIHKIYLAYLGKFFTGNVIFICTIFMRNFKISDMA